MIPGLFRRKEDCLEYQAGTRGLAQGPEWEDAPAHLWSFIPFLPVSASALKRCFTGNETGKSVSQDRKQLCFGRATLVPIASREFSELLVEWLPPRRLGFPASSFRHFPRGNASRWQQGHRGRLLRSIRWRRGCPEQISCFHRPAP